MGDGTVLDQGEADGVEAGFELDAHPALYAPHQVGVWLDSDQAQLLYGETGERLAKVPSGHTVSFGTTASGAPGYYPLVVDGVAWPLEHGVFQAP